MKLALILFFVAHGRVSEAQQKQGHLLAAKTGKKVVFRNGTVADREGEPLESCEGVCGAFPKGYTKANEAAKAAGEDAPYSIYELPDAPAEEDDKEPDTGTAPPVNELGLPEGSPDNVDDLKAALAEAGVAFDGRSGPAKLVELYRAEVLDA